MIGCLLTLKMTSWRLKMPPSQVSKLTHQFLKLQKYPPNFFWSINPCAKLSFFEVRTAPRSVDALCPFCRWNHIRLKPSRLGTLWQCPFTVGTGVPLKSACNVRGYEDVLIMYRVFMCIYIYIYMYMCEKAIKEAVAYDEWFSLKISMAVGSIWYEYILTHSCTYTCIHTSMRAYGLHSVYMCSYADSKHSAEKNYFMMRQVSYIHSMFCHVRR